MYFGNYQEASKNFEHRIKINHAMCLEWGLNLTQGALFDLLNEADSWAQAVIIDGETYHWTPKEQIIEMLPLVFNKPDTVYRNLKELARREVIEHKKEGQKDLVRITRKGKEWNEGVSK